VAAAVALHTQLEVLAGMAVVVLVVTIQTLP
jgi:hypothetical protein